MIDTPSPLTSVTMLKDGVTLIGGGADGVCVHVCMCVWLTSC